MRFDADKPAEGALDVTIDVTSADMNSADVNKAISEPEWFDFAGLPQAGLPRHGRPPHRRESVRGPGMLQPQGRADRSRRSVHLDRAPPTPRDRRRVHRQALDFGIGTGEWAATDVIGADVKLRFKLLLRKAG